MLTKRSRSGRGAWRINTAQVIIIVIAIGCVAAVFNAYQQSHEAPPPPSLVDVTDKSDPKQARYAAQVQAWQAKMTAQGMTVTWPYLGQNNVARVDLPSKVPVTLADWGVSDQAKAAVDAYHGFYAARVQARIASPSTCIVHVFLTSANGPEEVAQASASGVVTSADQNLGSG